MTENQRLACLAGGLGLTALGYGQLRTRRALRFYRGKTVLITGGTRGLGLALAHELSRGGAHLILCARKADELDRAAADLRARGTRVQTFVCDVGHRHQVQHMLDVAGPVDVLINNAGIIFVGPLENQGLEEFEHAMDVMYWGTVYCTLAVLPQMLERGSGAILNVTSIGGRVTVPHLLPYSCAKAAAVAFSEGVRQEMGPRGLRVLTAVPGLMRTGSYDNALFVGDATREYTWFSLSSSLPLITMPAEEAARQLLTALYENRAEHRLTLAAELLARVHGLFPGRVTDAAGLVGRVLLPAARGNDPPVEGQSLSGQVSGWLTAAQALGRAAKRRFQAHKSTRELEDQSQRRHRTMTRTTTRNGSPAAQSEPASSGSELISTPGFTLGLGLGLLVGAVTSGLLMTRAGADLVSFLETKTGELKDKAQEMLEGSELKEKAVEMMRGKAAETLMSVKDSAAEKITGAIESAAGKLTSVVEKTASLSEEEPLSAGSSLDHESEDSEGEEKAAAGGGSKTGGQKGKSSGGAKKS